MKKPVVDYHRFRLSRLNEPEFAHLKLLGWWLVYFALFFLTENFIPLESCHVIHCRLDDVIPFCEYFLIPYVLWYVLVAGSLLYFALYNIDSFRRLQIFLTITQLVAMAIYILYPNRQDLRPESFANDNLFTWGLGLLYRFDTNSNVCPSLHAAYSLGIASVWSKEKGVSPWVKGGIWAFALLVCASTTLVKQHSAVDVFLAVPVCLLAEGIVYKDFWRNRLRVRIK